MVRSRSDRHGTLQAPNAKPSSRTQQRFKVIDWKRSAEIITLDFITTMFKKEIVLLTIINILRDHIHIQISGERDNGQCYSRIAGVDVNFIESGL